MAKRAAIVAACVMVLGFAAWRLWPGRGRGVTPEMVNRPRVCEECGHRFGGSPEPIVAECPKCHKRAGVRVRSYVCGACGERFEAFRERTADATLEELDLMTPPELVYKREGGEWMPSVQELGEIKCPKCASGKVGPPRPQ